MVTISLKEPIEVNPFGPSENYSLIIRDADDVYHFWRLDGIYDGCDVPGDLNPRDPHQKEL